MFTVITALLAFLAYLAGSINTSVILSKSMYGEDVRDSGSGNAGATNMLRTYGAGIAVLTLICDILKGALLVLLATWLDVIFSSYFKNSPMTDFERIYLLDNLKYIVGIFAVLGHDFPIWFGFRGGKGVATSLGVILALNPIIGLIVLIIALLIMIFSRYVSLGSVIGAVVYPFIVLTYILAGGESFTENIVYIIMAFSLAFLLIIKHHSNIKRLKNGTENMLFAKKSGEDTEETEDAEDDTDFEEE
ncbi:MAG TPA: acyl-phosphate glycerol 3-phosphate acyltransferase [Clostridiales bacterium]|nr:acyl-phosphate glycerol 3-phosphate acyltransferase [Clostridiales bacterium]